MSKRKGSAAERELIKKFWAVSWAAIRVAGSGSMHFPSPDLLAANKIRRLAIEAKSTKQNVKYFPKQEIRQLRNFSSYFGAEPWLAIKFSSKWTFVNPEDLLETKNNFVFRLRDVESRGLSFEQLTQTNNQRL